MDGFRPPSPPPSPPPPPILPHDLPSAAHSTAPSSDLHLAHLLLSIPEPDWLTLNAATQGSSSGPFGPESVSSDRLAPDELENLPSGEADRLRATYMIEDHLDSTPGTVLSFEGGRTLEGIIDEVAEALQELPTGTPVLVARLRVQPPGGKGYYWEQGGADFVRFERTAQGELLWRPVEIALSQGVHSSHRILALLHLYQLAALLPRLDNLRPAEPLIWIVDPVEYAHAQLREMSQWGWSEHLVALPPSSSFLPGPFDRGDEAPSPDDLGAWLRYLLDFRITNILSLPNGCLSAELLPSAPIDSGAEAHFSAVTTPGPGVAMYPLAALVTARGSPRPAPRSPTTPPPSTYSPDSAGPSTPPYLVVEPRRRPAFGRTDSSSLSPSRNAAFLSQPSSLVSSTFLLAPPPEREQLPHFACRACGEHAFMIALSNRLAEEQDRRDEWGEPEPMPMTPGRHDGAGDRFSEELARKGENIIGLGPKGRAANEAMDRDEQRWSSAHPVVARLARPVAT